MKKLVLVVFLSPWAISLTAQTTRGQADTIVKEHLQNENLQNCSLYVNVNEPNQAGIVLTTSNEEVINAKYTCWTYYVDETEQFKRRYFFVKQDNGNLLEVITNDMSGDLSQWKLVNDPLGLTEFEINNIKPLYPNPTDDLLNIPCTGDYTRVEIHDLKGVRLFSELISGKEVCVLNVSFLKTGIYLLSVYGETRVIYKVIKN